MAIDYPEDRVFMLRVVSKTITDLAADYLAFLKSECAKTIDFTLTWDYVKVSFLKRLTIIRQRPSESMFDYFHRFTKLARTCYSVEELNSEVVKTTMRNSFAYGILDRATTEKVLKLQPADVEAVFELTSHDQEWNQKFAMCHNFYPYSHGGG